MALLSRIAFALKSATSIVNVSAAAAPSSGQVLTATGTTAATWQTQGGGTTSVMLIPAAPFYDYGAYSSRTASTNTEGYFGLIYVESTITTAKFSFMVSTYTADATLDIGLYSQNGQTLHWQFTTATITGTGTKTETLVQTISPGWYYIGVVPNGTSNIDFRTWVINSPMTGLYTGITSEPTLCGKLSTLVAGTLPATFDPAADLTAATNSTMIFRLDN